MFIIITLFVIAIAYLIARKIAQNIFSKEVSRLFHQSTSISENIIDKNVVHNLPEPVKLYLLHALKNKQNYIGYVRMKHNGQFRPGIGKNWMEIQGEHYATMLKPGFLWKGTTRLFTAYDKYINDKGSLHVSLLSIYNIISATGIKYNEGELLRWLGESLLYPTNFLPSERISWSPIDRHLANLNFKYKGLNLDFKITFNDKAEITQMETKRYMGEENLETWVIKVGNYKELNQVMIPTNFEVLWRLKKGDFSYAKFNITKVEYEIPETFQ